MKLPAFVETELARISQELDPVALNIKELLLRRSDYNRKVVKVEYIRREAGS